MNSRRRLKHNIAALTALQFLAYVAPLLTVPYLVRVLKPAEFGLLAFAQGIVLYFDLLTDFGFNLSATRAIAAQRDQIDAISRIFWSTLTAKLILMSLSGVLLTLLVAFTPKLHAYPSLYAVNFLYVIGTALFPIWLFQGLEEITIAALALGIARILTVPALFLWVRSKEDLVIAATIQASVQLVATVLVTPLLLKRIRLRWHRPSYLEIEAAFKAGWPLFLGGSALYLCNSSTTVILGFVAGSAQVGYYSAADKLIKAAISLLSPVGQALYPHITALKTESHLSALALIRKSFVFTGLLSLCASLGTFVLADPVCRLVLGPAFGPSASVLRWLSPLPLIFGLMSVLGTQTMLVFEMDSTMSRIMLASALGGIPLTLALAFPFGANGAAAASLTLAAAMLAAMAIKLRARGLRVWQYVSST